MKYALSLALLLACPSLVGSQVPGPTPAPVVIPTPDPVTEPVAKIEGRTTAKTSFVLYVTLPAPETNARVTWSNEFPQGAAEPDKSKLIDGREQWLFLDAEPGTYRIHGTVQVPVDGLDPFVELRHVVVVGDAPKPLPPGPGPKPPGPEPPVVVVPAVGTAATYVYELRDDGAAPIPSGVLAGLNRLNREKKIVATLFEQPPAGSAIPKQYEAPYAAAKAAGLPALVITKDGAAVSVVKAPTTSDQVFGAVQ